jgi:ABC-type branched-subunit amino acid transport system permease subunit
MQSTALHLIQMLKLNQARTARYHEAMKDDESRIQILSVVTSQIRLISFILNQWPIDRHDRAS